MKRWLLLACLFLVPACGIVRIAQHYSLRKRPYNLLLITLDTTRADRLGCYGCKYALTPALDALARNGTLFEQCRTVVPLTLPAHATMLTGLQPPEHGLRINGRGSLPEHIPTLTEFLKSEGYKTGAFIACVVLDHKYGLAKGFDVYDDLIKESDTDESGEPRPKMPALVLPSRPGDEVVDSALDWLKNNAHEPFFCWVHLYDPHSPYKPHPEIDHVFEHNYDAEIAFMDQQVGRLVEFVEAQGLLKETVIIAVGDHGECLGEHEEQEHGMTVYEAAIRVPFIISQPGRVRERNLVKEAMSIMDILPTIYDLLELQASSSAASGVTLAGHLQRCSGESVFSALIGKSIKSRVTYGETDDPYLEYGWAPLRSLTTENLKYIRSPIPELYHLEQDPNELTNVVEQFPGVADDLDWQLAQLEQSMEKTTAGTVILSEDERRQLESLGYAASSKSAVAGDSSEGSFGEVTCAQLETLKDIKTMLPLLNQALKLQGKIMAGEKGSDVLTQCRKLVKKSPETTLFYHLLCQVLAEQGRLDEAADWYMKSLEYNPDDVGILANLGSVLMMQGKYEEAVDYLTRASRVAPSYSKPLKSLGYVRLRQGRIDKAIEHFSAALGIEPESHGAHKYLADALKQKGEFEKAVNHYSESLRLNPGWTNAASSLAWTLATCEDPEVRDAERALPLAWDVCEKTEHKDPSALDILAAAYAVKGRYDRAMTTAEQAIALARSGGKKNLAAEIQERLKLYQQNKPFIEKITPNISQ